MTEREWEIDEDVVMLDMLKRGMSNDEMAYLLHRPVSAIAHRIAFHEHHEITFGPDGAAVLRKKVPAVAVSATASPTRVPLPYEGALMKREMNKSL